MATEALPIASAPAPVAPAPAAPASTPAATPGQSLADLVRESIVPLNTEAAPVDGGTPTTPAPDAQQDAPALEPMVLPDDGVAPPATAAPAVSDPNAPAAEDAPLDFTAEDLKADSVSEDGKRHFFDKNKAERLLAAGNFIKQLQEIVPQVTPSAIIDAVKRAGAADALMTKYQLGASNPSDVNDVLDLFTGEIEVNGVKQQPTPVERQAFGALVLNALDRLQRINPQAMQGVYRVHNQQTVEGLRARARALPEGPDREQKVALALRFEQEVFGKFTPRDQWLQAQPTDPIEQQRQQIARERQTLVTQQQEWQRTQYGQLVASVGEAQEAARQEPITQLLDRFKDNPIGQKFRSQMHGELLQAVQDTEIAHPEWAYQHQTLEQQALMQPTPQNIQALNDYRRNISKRVVAANAKAVIEKYNSIALQNNQADKDRALRPIVNTPSPNGATTQAPNGAMESVMKQPDLKNAIRETIRQTAAGVRL